MFCFVPLWKRISFVFYDTSRSLRLYCRKTKPLILSFHCHDLELFTPPAFNLYFSPYFTLLLIFLFPILHSLFVVKGYLFLSKEELLMIENMSLWLSNSQNFYILRMRSPRVHTIIPGAMFLHILFDESFLNTGYSILL